MNKPEPKFDEGDEVRIEPRKLDVVVTKRWYKESIDEWVYSLETIPAGQTHIYTEKNIS